jgi:hypothetical protein
MLADIDAEREQNLLALDALLAEPLVVEAPGRGPRVRVCKNVCMVSPIVRVEVVVEPLRE